FLLFVILYVCLHLPLSAFILHHGLQHWKKPSHCDCFTYHLAGMELVGITGYILACFAIYMDDALQVLRSGTLLYCVTWFGEMCFHILTCAERYLAVVHPIMYLKLRSRRWIRTRNVVAAVVWVLCLFWVILVLLRLFVHLNLCLVILSLVVVSFCNLSVLGALMHPGPGEQDGGRERADQSKQRAFYTILAILGTLVLRFAWGLFWTVVYLSEGDTDCVTMTIDVWFNLPSSLVLPLLFVHRKGRFLFWKKVSHQLE
uniref:G-protein coupled receptors family 1 profile domain-containing protein n=1 Tax=Poecilia formosa TaxID=48698 RepID=A0A096M325_POEFO